MDQISSPGFRDDYLGPATAVLPEPGPRRRSGKRLSLIAGTAVLALGVGAGVYAATSFLSGGGSQPENVLPAGAVAFAKLDLDPAANQKIAVFQLSRKFPDLASSTDSDSKSPIGDIFADGFADSGLDYNADVKPWLGDRAAFAVYPARAGDQAAQPAIAIAYTDEAKMSAAMKKLTRQEDEIGWTTSDGFVLISDSAVHAKDLAKRAGQSSLADQDEFSADTAGLEGDQIAVAWADLGAAYRLAAADGQLAGAGSLATPGAKLSGRIALGLHAAGNYIEVQGKTYDVKVETATSALGSAVSTKPGTGLAGQMPADSLVAASMVGLDQALSNAWNQINSNHAAGAFGPAAMAEGFGLRLPSDFPALLGSETAVAISATAGQQPTFTIRSREGDLKRAQEISRSLSPMLGRDISVAKTPDGFVAGDDPENVKAAAKGASPLAESKVYRLAVPDADAAGMVVFVNLGKLIDSGIADDPQAPRLKALSAAGLTVTGGANPSLRLRVTVR